MRPAPKSSIQGAKVALSLALALGACGGPRLITAPSGPGLSSAVPVTVDFPPPPAQIEEIPLSHHGGNPCVWRDGYWDWTGRRWEWQAGRAVLPPPGCLFSEPKLVWSADSLSFFRPAWYPDPAEPRSSRPCLEVACVPTTNVSRASP